MVHTSRLLGLPRELRDMIYVSLLTSDGGYIYDPLANRLRRADKEPICLDISLTCRLIAAEVRGLCFRLNTITFSTISTSTKKRDCRASHFHYLMNVLHHRWHRLFTTCAPDYLTDQAYDQIVRAYPQFASLVDEVRTPSPPAAHSALPTTPQRELPSTYRAFLRYALQAMYFYNHRFAHHAADTRYQISGADALERLIYYRPPHWGIPADADLSEMRAVILGDADEIWTPSLPGESSRFSAAAAAIRFLEGDPVVAAQVCRVVLDEDRPSAASPECHAMGLVAVCRGNPRMRVERRVNWHRAGRPHALTPAPWHLTRAATGETEFVADGTFEVWRAEAAALGEAGMPGKSFRLVVDGSSGWERGGGGGVGLTEDAVRCVPGLNSSM